MPHMIMEPFEVAYRRATSRMVCASTPQIAAITSGEYFFTFSASAS